MSGLAYGQSYVKFELSPYSDLMLGNSARFGFTYDTENGKVKRQGSRYGTKISLERFKLKLDGAYLIEDEQRISFDWNYVQAHNGRISLQYCHPKDQNIVVYDTIHLPLIDSVAFETFKPSFGIECNPLFKVFFTNGKTALVRGAKFASLLDRYNYAYSVQNGSFNSDGILRLNDFSNSLETSFVEMIVETHIGVFNLRKDFDLGANIYYQLYEKIDEENVKNKADKAIDSLHISISSFNDSLYRISVSESMFSPDREYVINPELGKFVINTLHSSNILYVSVTIPKEFLHYKECIVVQKEDDGGDADASNDNYPYIEFIIAE